VHGSDTTIICEGCVCVPKGTWVFAHRCMYDSMKALCGVKQHTLCCRLMVDSARTLHGVAVQGKRNGGQCTLRGVAMQERKKKGWTVHAARCCRALLLCKTGVLLGLECGSLSPREVSTQPSWY